MKTFRLLAASLFFAAIFTVSASAQTTATPIKVGLINTLAFDNDKGGITKYTTAMNSLETEFKPDSTALDTMATKINSLGGELEGLKKQLETPNPAVPINREAIQTNFNTKYTEWEKLQREYKFKQEDAKVRFDRRRQTLMGPILQDIGKAMQEFAKQKGYTVILDGAKLEEAAILLAIGDEKIDVTKDFIAFYNTRPATTAATTTTPPKQQ